MSNAVLRRDAVERVTGLPRSTIYEFIAKGVFPKPIRIGARSVGWLEDEVGAWLSARIAERDGGSTNTAGDAVLPAGSSGLKQALQGFAVSVEVAASVLGIGRNAAYRAVKLGDIPSVKIGGRFLVPTAHLRRMLGLEGGAAA